MKLKPKKQETAYDKMFNQITALSNNLQREILTLPLQNPSIPYSEINIAITEIQSIESNLLKIILDLYKNNE